MKKYLLPIVIFASLGLAFGVYQLPKIVFGASGDTLLIDSYPESNYTTYTRLEDQLDSDAKGQTFTVFATTTLDRVKWYLKRGVNGSGTAYAKIYNISGTNGTNAIPAGNPLATSSLDIATGISSSPISLATFNFTGTNRIILTPGNYAVTIETNASTLEYLRVGLDDSVPFSHQGNAFGRTMSTQVWSSATTSDRIFYVYGEPQGAYWSSAGDGCIRKVISGNNHWAAMHDATSGSVDCTSNISYIEAGYFGFFDNSILARTFLPFDTSAIPTNAVVTSATLYTYVTVELNGTHDGKDYVTVVQTSQVDSTSLTANDYDNIGTIKGSNDLTLTSTSTEIYPEAYRSFTLNTTGKSWIKREGETSNCGTTAGVTCLGIRDGHDIEDSDPGDFVDLVAISTSEDTSGTKDPFLVVTYTIPPAEPGDLNVTEKTLIVNSGTLQIKGN